MKEFSDLLIASSVDMLRVMLVWSWQALLLLAAVWIVLRFYRSRSASIRYQIWLVALIAVILLPVAAEVRSLMPSAGSNAFSRLADMPAAIAAPFSASETAVVGLDVEEATAEAADATAVQRWTSLVLTALVATWLSGAGVTAVRFARSYLKLRRMRLAAATATPADLGCDDDTWQADGVPIALSDEVPSPMVAGLFHPMILLPADVLSWTTPEERLSILRHELIHVRRRDHYVNLFQMVLSTLFFFHPLIRYACQQLNLERELACDEQVLGLGTGARVYAESILKVAERNLLPDAVHQPAFAARRTLERRIETVLRRDVPVAAGKRWQLLAAPIALILVVVWLVVPSRKIGATAQDLPDELVEPTVDQILERHVRALGGQGAIERINSRVIKGSIEWNGQPGTIEHRFKAPDLYTSVTRLDEKGFFFSEGFNGKSGWLVGRERSRVWSDDEVATARRQRGLYRDLKLRSIYPKMVFAGVERIGEREAYTIVGIPAQAHPEKLYFDKRTGLLIRSSFQVESPEGKRVFQYDYEDYRDVDGVKVPFVIRRTSPIRYVIRLEEVEHNVSLNESDFDAPSDLDPSRPSEGKAEVKGLVRFIEKIKKLTQ
jgi:beta-lactamase regulating signal transducer with metallopeptidase domain